MKQSIQTFSVFRTAFQSKICDCHVCQEWQTHFQSTSLLTYLLIFKGCMYILWLKSQLHASLFVYQLALPSKNKTAPEVHLLLGEKVVCATVSLPQYMLVTIFNVHPVYLHICLSLFFLSILTLMVSTQDCIFSALLHYLPFHHDCLSVCLCPDCPSS